MSQIHLFVISINEIRCTPLQWRRNEHDGVSNPHPHDCSSNRLFRRRSKKTISKIRFTGLCAGNSPVTGTTNSQQQIHTQMRSNILYSPSICWYILYMACQGCVSLHSPNEFSWHLILVDANHVPNSVMIFVLEIRWRPRIIDAETLSKFWIK